MFAYNYRSTNRLYQEYCSNPCGRDFVIGDLHGEYQALIQLLKMVGFREGVDRLFCAGDVTDRGPQPLPIISMIEEGVIIAVRGNHDQWCIDASNGIENPAHRKYGGEWFYKLTSNEKETVARVLSQLPVALTFIGPNGGRYGLVHAECASHRWDWFIEAICGEYGQSFCDRMTYEALWRRTRIRKRNEDTVLGIDRVFVGHTVVDQVTDLGNVTYLDTGGCFDGGRLTLVELKTDGQLVHHAL